jgi:hypothetical protein
MQCHLWYGIFSQNLFEHPGSGGISIRRPEDGGRALVHQVGVVDDGSQVGRGRAVAVVDGKVEAEVTKGVKLCNQTAQQVSPDHLGPIYDFENIFAKKVAKPWRLLFKKRRITIFFAENWRKSPKIVIITSAPYPFN